MMENHNVNPDIDLDKVLELIREKNGIVMELNKDYTKVNERVKNLVEARRVINEIAAGKERRRRIVITK